LVGCAPLVANVWRIGPLSARILEFASDRYGDYCDFVVHPDRAEEVLVALAEWFRENLHRWDVVWLRSLREESRVRREDGFLSKLSCSFHAERFGGAPYLRLQSGWVSYEDAVNGKRARSMRYKVRKLFREFNGRFERAAAGEGIDAAIEKLMDLHQERMRAKHQRGSFADARVRREFGALVKDLASRGLANVHTITSGRRTIAAVCTFEFRGTVSYYQGGFDVAYARLSPGLVIHCLRITEGLHSGAHEYDFLKGSEPYKFMWADRERPLYQIEFLTGSWRRFLYHWWEQARCCLSEWEWPRSLYLWCRDKTEQLKAHTNDRSI
jgi:CelD/BcsL family acetyltransferase involved in cellulose biosynthesis